MVGSEYMYTVQVVLVYTDTVQVVWVYTVQVIWVYTVQVGSGTFFSLVPTTTLGHPPLPLSRCCLPIEEKQENVYLGKRQPPPLLSQHLIVRNVEVTGIMASNVVHCHAMLINVG